jgi:hypothetical protein
MELFAVPRAERHVPRSRRLSSVARSVSLPNDMLEEFLRKWRRVRSDSSTPAVRAVRGLSRVCFRFPLAQLVIADRRHGAREAVRAGRENDRPLCATRRVGRGRLPEVEPVFRATGQYNALCKCIPSAETTWRCSKHGQSTCNFLVIFACISTIFFCRLVEGEWTDPEIPDPLSDMFALLTARRDRALTQQWGVWLAGKDTERALKVGPTH